MVMCMYVSEEEPGCDNRAEWVMREIGRGFLPPYRLRVPFCEAHRKHLLTSPDVEIEWEVQGRVDQFPVDSLYQRGRYRGGGG